MGEDWVPFKLDYSVDVPDRLDINRLRGTGLQPGEKELPEVQEGSTPGKIWIRKFVII